MDNKRVRASAPQLADVVPYDPKYLPSEVMLSANENTSDVPQEVRRAIEHEIRKVSFNRYPDPLANELRDLIAEANGVDREQVLVGNGGDELLFNIALAWGGPERTYLDLPPTFSAYRNNAQLTNTKVVEVPRLADFSVDMPKCFGRLREGDIDYMVVTSPNNPTGNLIDAMSISQLADASDTLIVVDEAYFEFSRNTARLLLDTHPNVCILRTFSKAFSMAGVRLGYLLASPEVINELKKVRQPYSVDALSQAAARIVYAQRGVFEKGIDAIISERERVYDELQAMEKVQAYPSDANYILFRLSDVDAGEVWQKLFDAGVLVRDFSKAPALENCLRVSIGNEEENERFLESLRGILGQTSK